MKRFLTILGICVAVFVLAGCGKKSPTAPGQPAPVTKDAAPPVAPSADGSIKQESQGLPALPVDNKAAIDQEVKGIDQELQATSDDTDPNELSNSQFGL